MDYLRGLKENVIMGRLIPAGTGMEFYRRVKIAGEDVVEEEPLPEQEVSFAEVCRITPTIRQVFTPAVFRTISAKRR